MAFTVLASGTTRPRAVVKTKKVGIAPSKVPVEPLSKIEIIAGRMAMQGTLWGAVDYMMFNEGIKEQLMDPKTMLITSCVSALVAAGSAATLDEMGEKEYLYWKPDAEVLNGRVAMAAVTVLALLT